MPLLANLSCLSNCFPKDPSAPGFCITSLLRDVLKKKTCDFLGNPGIWGITSKCEIGTQTVKFNGTEYSFRSITSGTCSQETEKLLLTEQCKSQIFYQPNILSFTLRTVIGYSCNTLVFISFEEWVNTPFYFLVFLQTLSVLLAPMSSSIPQNPVTPVAKSPTPQTYLRLPPIKYVNETSGSKTDFNFTHTRHRYPWICSLRTRGASPEHLCAVTLLSTPPSPL